MQGAWQRWRWALLAAAVTFAAFSALVVEPSTLRWLGLREMRPAFADLVAVLAAGEARQQGLDVYRANPLDPFNRPHVYGPAWLLTGELGLTRSDSGWLGMALAVGFIGAAVALCAPRTPRAALLVVALLLSPPVVLALERGNNDLVIYVLLAGAAAQLGRSGALAMSAASAAFVAAAVLKFYPLVCLPALLAQRAGRRRALPWMLASGAVLGAAWFAQRVELARVFALAPEPVTIFSFGLRLSRITWQLLPDERLWLLLGAAPVLVVGGWWVSRSSAALRALVPVHGVVAAAAVAGAASWVFCYLWTTNFPYRVLLLILVAPVLLRADGSRPAAQLVAGMLAVGWLIAPLDWCATAIDGGRSHPALLALLALMTGSHQALAFILSVAVAVMLFGWTVRCLFAGRSESSEEARGNPGGIRPGTEPVQRTVG